MLLFGYKAEYNRLSPKDLRDWESEGYAHPYFGVGSWTFNNPTYRSIPHPTKKFRKLRQLTGYEKGLYVHVWLFGYRFDLHLRKRIFV